MFVIWVQTNVTPSVSTGLVQPLDAIVDTLDIYRCFQVKCCIIREVILLPSHMTGSRNSPSMRHIEDNIQRWLCLAWLLS